MIYEKYLLDVNDVGTLLHCSSLSQYQLQQNNPFNHPSFLANLESLIPSSFN